MPIGNFYCTVMPFGLKNTGATYEGYDYHFSWHAPLLPRILCGLDCDKSL